MECVTINRRKHVFLPVVYTHLYTHMWL